MLVMGQQAHRCTSFDQMATSDLAASPPRCSRCLITLGSGLNLPNKQNAENKRGGTSRMEQSSWKELFRIGGVAQVIAGLLYLALVVILAQVGGLPTTGEALLHSIASKSLLMQSTMIL